MQVLFDDDGEAWWFKKTQLIAWLEDEYAPPEPAAQAPKRPRGRPHKRRRGVPLEPRLAIWTAPTTPAAASRTATEPATPGKAIVAPAPAAAVAEAEDVEFEVEYLQEEEASVTASLTGVRWHRAPPGRS